ncbi:glutamate racemase [Parasphingorhabdus litoris]|uniref:Glutamate racemase n=1 Tax=Parasphingorhabdus litoris TaxID=394733 RepID=A0ABP3KMF9_9SPHN|nr:glutamate racemase [Parasphingorhabdus litoris]
MAGNRSKATQPILFFDTGIGGLSVLKEAQNLMPNAPIVYAADYAGMPYGMKSEEELSTRIPLLLGRLVERYNPQLVTIACNTASTIALDVVRSVLDIPVVGTVPAIKPASLVTKTGVIGLLGTRATIRQPYVDRLAAEFASDKTLIRFGAPDLVEAAETKLRGQTSNQKFIDDAVAGLLKQEHGDQIDTVVLACTHFPLVQEELQKSFVRAIQFIDGSRGIAQRINYLTSDTEWPKTAKNGTFVTTGAVTQLQPYHQTLTHFGLTEFDEL